MGRAFRESGVSGPTLARSGDLPRRPSTGLEAGLDDRSRYRVPPWAARSATLDRAGQAAVAHKLVIVESPTKARKIGGYLGQGYVVESSIGHIRDLPQSAAETPAKI